MAKRKPRTGPLEQAFSRYPGTMTELADELGVTVSALSQWRKIPLLHVPKLAQLLRMSRYKLRPDIYGPSTVTLKKSNKRLAVAS